jgi:NTP pyrophosphatase (non-canonical NTP hydrolase)
MSPATTQVSALTLAEYATHAEETDRFSTDSHRLEKLRFGYFGEIGGLLAALKKVSRDQLLATETEVAAEELGDALWYLTAIATLLHVPADDFGTQCLNALRQRFHEKAQAPVMGVSFRQIDGFLAAHRAGEAIDRATLLGELASAAGTLTQQDDAQLRLMAAPGAAEHLGGLLAGLALVCASFGLLLEQIARDNLDKTHSRWPGNARQYTSPFDNDPNLPDYEKLPRLFDIKFEERVIAGKSYVVQSWKGVYIGDRLTDNSNEPDDYRYHDIFHLAYVAHLGWSPVIRGLLKLKRKSQAIKDENEDGARAMIIEEGIATWIFNDAKKRQMYRDIEAGKLEYALLKQIQSMVRGYEVDKCPLWQWEAAILDGFKVFRQLQESRGGTVRVDMNKHSLTFTPNAGNAA